MAKTTTATKEKLVSALSLWRSYDVTGDLNAKYLQSRFDEQTKLAYTQLAYDGHTVEDGRVRIFAYFARPLGDKKCPAILLLKEAGKPLDLELMNYFVQKGYAVLMPDYSGEMPAPLEQADEPDSEEAVDETEEASVEEEEACTKAEEARAEAEAQMEAALNALHPPFPTYTVYPPSLAYANYKTAQGLYDLEGIPSDQTCWYEWTYVALYSIEYLKSREDIDKIGVVGIRMGGEVAWKTMLSPDVACGIPVNAAGWLSVRNTGKFSELSAINMTDERHRYIAAVDSQSYATFVKCPVLMLCALSDIGFDADRAYDTYARIGGENRENEVAIVYSAESGSCIGKDGLQDMDIFLEKHLKGREVFIPASLNLSVKEEHGKLMVEVSGDEEAIVEEMGICYAEADPAVRSAYREWQCIYSQNGTLIKDGKIECEIEPFIGAKAGFVYAYAKYLNGFVITSSIMAKHLRHEASQSVGSRMLFYGDAIDCFRVASHEDYSVAGIFLEEEATPKLVAGYGGIKGAYSLGGIKTYKISSPRYVARERDSLKFDVYAPSDCVLLVGVEVSENGEPERYDCRIPVKGGGKWKRLILEAKDFKSVLYGRPLTSFTQGGALSFGIENGEEKEFAVTNILWL